jgi:predicted ATP-dependent serine protease
LQEEVRNVESSLRSQHENTLDELRIARSRENEEMQIQKLIDSLNFTHKNARYNAIEPSYGSTFQWAVDAKARAVRDASSAEESKTNNVALGSRLRSGEGLFWINGKPGSGKSTLMKFLADHQRTQEIIKRNGEEPCIISSLIWDAGSIEERSLRCVTATLLYQLLEHCRDIAQRILSTDSTVRHKPSLSDWS